MALSEEDKMKVRRAMECPQVSNPYCPQCNYSGTELEIAEPVLLPGPVPLSVVPLICPRCHHVRFLSAKGIGLP